MPKLGLELSLGTARPGPLNGIVDQQPMQADIPTAARNILNRMASLLMTRYRQFRGRP